ncbi:hypothetical protein [Bacteriovorax sp. Seq25_V]|uniref:hypothetical protein n=1 Tax=Bacteriovorax sp. Seq25_V TaxID=1201288 RepID=UPI00038A50FD|nr:hypothetical protein [Bacteriovorax sp. Seq25_V]EQC46657.1 hypothetical protein M900_2420 [Bacteriovorax sp. Seq25_V]
MIKCLFLALVLTGNLSAREYKDPSKKIKKGLLENAEVMAPQEKDSETITASSDGAKDVNTGKVQYCGCVNLSKLLKEKENMTRKLISHEVIEDRDWSIRRKLDQDTDRAEAAVKKAAYMHELDRTEVICDAIKLQYKKVSAMKGDIQDAARKCNLVDI